MRGNRVATDGAPGATLLTGGLGYIGSHVAAAIREEHGVTSVVHLAGRKSAPESVLRPAWYFQQNFGALACVLEAMAQAGVGHLLRATSLRYFNVLGASSELRAEQHGTKLIPRVLSALSTEGAAEVFGDEHPTADGTCVRDYVHVVDLAQAAVRALAAVLGEARIAPAYNIGTGTGYSVAQVLDELGAVLGRPVPRVISPARAGDPAEVVAAVDLAKVDLAWVAQRDLTTMLSDAVESGPSAWRRLRSAGPDLVDGRLAT